MSDYVDERIVAMRFDNDQFESGVSTTLNTLERLKNKLQFKGAEDGIESLQNRVNRINFDGMLNSADEVTNKFNAMGAAAFGAIATISSEAIKLIGNTAKKLFDKYIIKPVSDGFEEYELIQNTIQTIYTNTKNKGTTIDEIEAGLDELNQYADETIYVMSDMTKAIGQFTNAGVSFDKSKTAVIGFANLAAAVGATNEQLSRVEYQASQAMSAGVFRLIDWNSIQNSPLGGEFFQKALIKNAGDAGEEIQKAINEGTISFRKSFDLKDSPNSNWLTTDVFIKTLEEFANDKELLEAATAVRTFTKLKETLEEAAGSGWAKTWQLVIGDFTESKALWTDVAKTLSSVLDGISDARNAIVSFWHDTGGRDMVVEGLKNLMEALTRVLKPIKEAFDEVLGPYLQDRLVRISELFEKLTGKMLIGEDTANGIKVVFKGIFTVVKAVLWVIEKIIDISSNAGWFVGKIFGDGFEIVGKISDAFGKLFSVFQKDDTEENIENKEKKISSLATSFSLIADKFEKIKNLPSKIHEIFDLIKKNERVIKLGEQIKEFGNNAWDGLQKIYEKGAEFFKGLKDNEQIKQLGESLKKLGDSVWDSIIKAGKFALDKLDDLFAWLNEPETKARAAELISNGLQLLSDAFEGIVDLAERASDALTGFFDLLNGNKNQNGSTEETKSEGVFGFLGNLLGFNNKNETKQAEESSEALEETSDALTETSEAIAQVSEAAVKLENASEKSGVRRGGFILGAIMPNFNEEDAQKEANNIESAAETFESAYERFYNAHSIKGENKETDENSPLKDFIKIGGVVGGLALLASGVISIIRFINSLSKGNNKLVQGLIDNVFTPIKGFIEAATTLFGFDKIVSAYKKKTFTEGIKNIAISIGIIVASIAGVAVLYRNYQNEFWTAVEVVGGILAVVTGISILISKINVNNTKGGTMLLGIAASVGVIAFAFYKLATVFNEMSNLKIDALIESIVLIMSGVAAIMLVIKDSEKAMAYGSKKAGALGRTSSWFGNEAWKDLLAIGASVYIIARGLSKLAKEDPIRIMAAGLVISGVMAMMVLIVKAINNTPVLNTDVFASFGKMVKQIGFAVLLMASSVAIITAISEYGPNPGAIWDAVGIVLILMAAMFIMIGVMQKLMSMDGKMIGSGDGLLKAAGAMVLLAAAVDLMLPAILVLTQLGHWDQDAMLWSIGSILALLFAMGSLLVVLNNSYSANLMKGAATMLGLASAVLILAIAMDALIPAISTLTIFAHADLSAMLWAVGSLLTLLFAMTVSLKMIGTNASGDMLKAAAAMVIMSVALDATIPVFTTLTILDRFAPKSLERAMLAVLALLFSISTVLAVVGKLDVDSNKILAFAGSFAIFAAGILVVSHALEKIGQIGSGAWDGVLVILSIFGMFALGSLLTMIPEVAAGMIIFAGAFLAFSAAAWVLAKAGETIAKSFDLIVKAVAKLILVIKMLAAIDKKDIEKITDNIETFVDGSYDIFVKLASAIVAGIETFIDAIYEVREKLAAKTGAVIGAFIDALEDKLGKKFQTRSPIGRQFGNWLGNIILDGLDSMILFLSENSDHILNTLTAAFLLIEQYIEQGIARFLDDISNILEYIGERISRMPLPFGIAEKLGGGFKAAAGSLRETSDEFEDTAEYIKGMISDLVNVDYQGTAETAERGIDSIASGIGRGLSNVENEIAGNQIDPSSIFNSLLPGGISESGLIPSITTSGNLLAGFLSSAFQTGADYEGSANEVASTFTNTVSSEENKNSSTGSGEALADAGNEGLQTGVSLFSSTGNSIVDGLVNTLLSPENLARVRAAAATVASAAAAGANSKDGADVNSPSRKTAYTATMMIEGITKTLKNGTKEAEYSGAMFGFSVASAINAASKSGFDQSPSITPVVEAGTLSAQANAINSLFGASRTMSVATTAKLASQDAVTMRSAAEEMRKMNVYNDSNVISSINTLQRGLATLDNTMNSVTDKIEGMQIAINGKRAIAYLTKEMDRSLGQVESRRKRGV